MIHNQFLVTLQYIKLNPSHRFNISPYNEFARVKNKKSFITNDSTGNVESLAIAPVFISQPLQTILLSAAVAAMVGQAAERSEKAVGKQSCEIIVHIPDFVKLVLKEIFFDKLPGDRRKSPPPA